MRFTITALGSGGGRTVGQVVADLVRYLEPRPVGPEAPSVTAPAVPSGDGPSSYYADRGTEAGRWLGYSAKEAGLQGAVDSGDFARVLAGRDPRTGERLLSAVGSAGRRPSLGAGQVTRTGPDGQALYAVEDAAAALGVSRREADALLAAGERHAAHSGAGAESPPEPGGAYLVPVVEPDGSRWVTGEELDRCEQARAVGVEPEAVAAGGAASDQLSVAEAARLGAVTGQYLRSLCRRWENHRQDIEAALAEGKPPRRAYVVAHRGTKRQWIITRAELVAFLERRTAPAVRVGYDLTLTTEKSLGVLALLGDERTRAAVLDAIQGGNDAGLAYLELHASAGRAGGKQVLARGLTVASFRHLTSRALDPFPHHHNVVANAVVDEHGQRRALDARGLYTHAQGASALATARMRHQLTSSLGVTWRRRRSGSWEIDGIPDEVLREFSRRRNEIEDAVAELEAEIGRRTSLEEVQAVITGTRPPKEQVDPSSLVAGWVERAGRHGFGPAELSACVGRGSVAASVDQNRLFAQLSSATQGLCANHSLFTRSDVLVALADLDYEGYGPLLVDADDMERLADEFLASEHVVALETTGAGGALGREEHYTTTEILGVQRRILAAVTAGAGAGAALVPDDVVESALASHPKLTGEQQHLVRAFCGGGRRVQCAVGRAGAGKTTTMAAAADAWRAAGFDVVGTAVKGEAARHLALGAGIATETVAWYLARADRPPLHDRSVLIVDEASTLSDRDLDALLHLAVRTGAAVRLVGDPDQHGAVAAGGMFRHLCQSFPEATPELATTHRVRSAADREAARLLRAGRSRDALARLAEAGHLHLAESDIELYVGMLQRWWSAHQAGSTHPMVDRRHATRRVLNRLARQLRRTNGELGDEELVTSDDRRFAVGDGVVARMAARHLHLAADRAAYVRNGASGTVVAVRTDGDPNSDAIDVAFDGVGVIALPRSFLDDHGGPGGRRDVGVDHAYAVTSYAVQGATFDESTSRIDDGATRSEAYVDITRGRRANHLFLTRAADALDGEHLPKTPDPGLDDSIADRLRRSGPERAAVEFPLSARRTRGAAAAMPADLAEGLPEPVDGPMHLRRRWKEAVHAVVAYRDTWHPAPARLAWGWAVGAPSRDPRGLEHRAEVIDVLESYAHDFAIEIAAGAASADAAAAHAVARLRDGGNQTEGRTPEPCPALMTTEPRLGPVQSDRAEAPATARPPASVSGRRLRRS